MKKILLVIALTLTINANPLELRIIKRVDSNMKAIVTYANIGNMAASCGKARVVIHDLITLDGMSDRPEIDKSITSITNYLKKCNSNGY